MVQLLDRHHDLFRWVAEFSLMPLHLLALGHQYVAATAIGSAVLVVYAASALRYARVHGMTIHG